MLFLSTLRCSLLLSLAGVGLAFGPIPPVQEPAEEPLAEVSGQEAVDDERTSEYAEGQRFDVFANWRSERCGNRIAADCAAMADDVIAQLEAWTGLRAPAVTSADSTEGDSVQRMLINLYRRPKDLVMARAGMGIEGKGGAPFHVPGTAEVHVAVQPMQTDFAFQELGTPPWLLRATGEGAGMAWIDWVAPGVRTADSGWALEGLVLAAVHDQLVSRGFALHEPAEDPALGAELLALRQADNMGKELVRSPLTADAGRAARWLLVTDLLEREPAPAPEAWAALNLQELEGADQRLAQAAGQPTAWILETEAFTPFGKEGQKWLQTAKGADSSRCWFPGPVGSERYAVSGKLTLYAPGQRNPKLARGAAQGNILLGRSDEGYISVAFNTFAGLSIFQYEAATGQFRTLLEQKGGVALASGVEFAFRVSVGPEFGAVALNGEPIGTFSVKDRDMSGSFGLGAQGSRGTCVWSEVLLER